MPVSQGPRNNVPPAVRPPLQTKGLILVRQPDESDESYAARKAVFLEIVKSRHGVGR